MDCRTWKTLIYVSTINLKQKQSTIKDRLIVTNDVNIDIVLLSKDRLTTIGVVLSNKEHLIIIDVVSRFKAVSSSQPLTPMTNDPSEISSDPSSIGKHLPCLGLQLNSSVSANWKKYLAFTTWFSKAVESLKLTNLIVWKVLVRSYPFIWVPVLCVCVHIFQLSRPSQSIQDEGYLHREMLHNKN